jgi:hypothetical protein
MTDMMHEKELRMWELAERLGYTIKKTEAQYTLSEEPDFPMSLSELGSYLKELHPQEAAEEESERREVMKGERFTEVKALAEQLGYLLVVETRPRYTLIGIRGGTQFETTSLDDMAVRLKERQELRRSFQEPREELDRILGR